MILGMKEHYSTDKNGSIQINTQFHYGFKAHIVCDENTEPGSVQCDIDKPDIMMYFTKAKYGGLSKWS